MEWARRKVFHGWIFPYHTEKYWDRSKWSLMTFDIWPETHFVILAENFDSWRDRQETLTRLTQSTHLYMCHTVSFMTCYVSSLDQRFPTSSEVTNAVFFFVVVASTNFRVWLFSHINFCFKPCRRLNGSQKTLLGLFLWLDDKQYQMMKACLFEFLSCFPRFLLPSPVTPPAPYSPRLPPPCSPPLLYISFSQIVTRGVKFKWIKQARGEEVIPGITCVIWGWIWSIKN